MTVSDGTIVLQVYSSDAYPTTVLEKQGRPTAILGTMISHYFALQLSSPAISCGTPKCTFGGIMPEKNIPPQWKIAVQNHGSPNGRSALGRENGKMASRKMVPLILLLWCWRECRGVLNCIFILVPS